MLGMMRRFPRGGRQDARLLPSVGALWASEPGLTLAVAVLSLAAGAMPALFALATGNLVGAVVGSAGGRQVTSALVVVGALLLAGDVVAAVQSVVQHLLRERFTHAMRHRALRAVQRPIGIAHLEEPAMLERLALVREQMKWDAGDLVSGGSLLLTRFAQGFAAMILVATFHWWAALLLAGTWAGAWKSGLQVLTHGLFEQLTALRRADYYRRVATQPAEAKEVRLFGLHNWLLQRYTEAWRAATATLWQAARGDRHRAVVWLLGVTAAHAAVFTALAHDGGNGHLSVARIAVQAQAILAMGVWGELGGAVWVENGLYAITPVLALERALAERELEQRGGQVPQGSTSRTLSQREGRELEQRGEQEAEGLPREALRYEGVRFRYPGRTDDALRGLTLTVPAGRSLAIVGDNGAGKTTLVKLLARLYEPDEGRITVDGRDLRTLDPVAWRTRLAALFQDFIHYELPVTDNIGFGAPQRRDDLRALEHAAERAGARALIDGLPGGWSTVLSPRYDGGIDLSGGQWQRIALARALFAVEAGASVLILDEPTAALDVRAEADLFDRFLTLTQGLTTILVSHRFSTVRRADRIVVLDGGRIVEEGSHDVLMALGGRYARMFALQADRFEQARGNGGEMEMGGTDA